MKVNKSAIEITEVPGIEFIRVEPAPDSKYGVHVTVKIRSTSAPSFSVDELGEVVEALGAALEHAREMAGMVETSAGVVWHKGASEPPAGVLAVVDCNGGIWHRTSDGKWRRGDLSRKWSELLTAYGPVTLP